MASMRPPHTLGQGPRRQLAAACGGVRHVKTLLTGARGQLGYELRRTLAPLGPVIACDRTELQVADPVSIRHVVRDTAPALIVNAGAYTAVDPAESEPDLAMAINGIAPGILAEEAKR